MVTTTGQASPLHYPTKVYGAICAADEFEILGAQQTGATWHSATTAGRSDKQAEGGAGGAGTKRGAKRVLDADESVSPAGSRTATSHVQWHVYWSPARCSSTIPNSASRLWSPDEHDAGSNAASSVRAISKPIRAGNDEGRPSTCFNNGPAGWRYPAYYSASCQSFGPQRTHPFATKPCLLSSASRGIR